MEVSRGVKSLGPGTSAVFGPAQQGCCYPLGREFPHPEKVLCEAHLIEWQVFVG